MKYGIWAAGVAAVVFLSGCTRGYEWGHTPAGSFDSDPFNLAPFGSPVASGNGMLYTLRSGSIDPDHIYGWARKTKGYYEALHRCLISDNTRCSHGYFNVTLEYPDSWRRMDAEEKARVARDLAIEAAQYLAFNDGLWHEMATWYGHRTFPLISDFQSALSWEDLYSDRLGTWIGARAIERGGHFEQNVTAITAEELRKRELVDTAEAIRITRTMENIAYREDPFAKKILWRCLDIGTGDGEINPVVFPGFTDKPPIALPAPTLAALEQRGIKVRVTVDPWSPKYAVIKKKADIQGDYEPALHNEKILAVIKQDARKQGFKVFD